MTPDRARPAVQPVRRKGFSVNTFGKPLLIALIVRPRLLYFVRSENQRFWRDAMRTILVLALCGWSMSYGSPPVQAAEPRDSAISKQDPSESDRVSSRQQSNTSIQTDDLSAVDGELNGLSAAEIFDRRMLPIVRSERASSCTECHFGGVELKNYVREDQASTFSALRDEGLIDLKNPDESKLLQFIARKPDNEDPLIARVRRSEFQAFRAWIRAAVKQPELLAAMSTDTKIGAELPVEVIRHMRRDRVLRSFVENIWSEMGRCVSCHSPELNRNKIGRNGFTEEDVDAISWVVPRDPRATLEKLVETGNIDIDDPDASAVVTKPAGLEDHGGGPKFAVGSRTDKNFRRFLNDYAAVVAGKYTRVDQLPDDVGEVAALTGQHLRIVDLPARFDKKLLRADIYRRVEGNWSQTPWATAENPVVGQRHLWQSMVFAVAPRDSARGRLLRADQPLPAGRYLIKIYVDRDDRAKADRDYELSNADFYGQVEINGPWPRGYQPPKIIDAPEAP